MTTTKAGMRRARTLRAARSARQERLPGQPTERAAKKRETHERILQSAGRIVRREGLRAASVPRVMGGAGVTVGGFYAHFHSKAAMDVEIISSLLGGQGRWLSGLEGSQGVEWALRAVKRYLSIVHRDNADGCPYPAVLSELASAPQAVKDAFTVAFEARVRAFEAQVPAAKGVSARERALAIMALTIGGLLLSRATFGHETSEELLAACRKFALSEAFAENAEK